MRHRKRRTKLGMMTSHRNATLRNIVRGLLKNQRIQTTLRRAKEARRLAEHLITLGKSDSVASRRRAYSIITDRDIITKLFKEVAPLFKDRRSGFTRIIPLGFRRGDGASLVFLELTEKKIIEGKPKKKKEKPAAKETKPEAPSGGKPEEIREAKPEAERKPAKSQEQKIKAISKAKPSLEEERKAEKARTEDKKIDERKSFLKNLRGFFRRKTNM